MVFFFLDFTELEHKNSYAEIYLPKLSFRDVLIALSKLAFR